MNQLVEWILYFYLYICISLVLFNILFVVRTRYQRHLTEESWTQWWQALTDLAPLLASGLSLPDAHIKLLQKRLRNDEQLIVYQNVLTSPDLPLTEPLRLDYLNRCAPVWEELARYYAHKDAMERAFFAYTLSELANSRLPNRNLLAECMLSYLENSTVYCREQVLCALYALGSDTALEQAFTVLTQHRWAHNAKLIADGLRHYTGDSTALVLHLWKNRTLWLDSILVGIIQFAADVSDVFSDPFASALMQEPLSLDVHLALMRYFRKNPAPAVQPYLYKALEHSLPGESTEYAIVAASTLCAYPCEQTHTALKHALHDANWYVRKNAAASLVQLGVSEQEIQAVLHSGDRYACEILEYTLQHEKH